MAKKYTVEVKEKQGCCSSCLGVIGLVILIGILAPVFPFIIAIGAVLLAILIVVWLVNYQKKKQANAEEFELVEREKQLEIERRKLQLDEQEKELARKRACMRSEKDDWSDF